MCTVTFVATKNRYFITSNRDENLMRKPAVMPQLYHEKETTLLYPKDAEAGGTWIAINDKGHAAVLLNGAFIKHISLPPYQRSRGLVCKDIISSATPVKCFHHLNLILVEPFTIIILQQDGLYECRWDGSGKYCRQMSRNSSYIWSSATLFNEEIVRKREQWFTKWQKENPNPTHENILHFHEFGGEGDKANDLSMNRHDRMLTVSITGIELTAAKGILVYKDLGAGKTYQKELAFLETVES